ncbi:MAG: AAA family ATPase [Eubacteriales bacterium]|nr:AAA family ATPase [Eubacteriales bacterium]
MQDNEKRLPVGIDDFYLLREENYYYLDKTGFIRELIRSCGMVNLFTRPRRFGKTLTMSMLKAFFEIGGNPELFHGLAIRQEKEVWEKYQGQFPVVSITLKGVEGESYEDALDSLRMLISAECKRLVCLKKSDRLDDDDKEVFELLRRRKSSEMELKYSLAVLMRMLHAHYGKKVILLIDEYDVPLDKANESGYYDRMVAFLRIFFGSAFKTNPDLRFAVLTGCLRISKESIFTGINNLKADGISNHRFDEYFGFTDENVRTILADYGLSSRYEEMREWYDGYHFGGTDVYCPWDVINHCSRLLEYPAAKPEAYWNNTSSNGLVKLFIDKADNRTREDIEKLIAGEAIERTLTENLTYAEVDEKIGNLWSVLYLTGYLTLDREKEAKQEDCARLVIPNKEVRAIFVDKIKSWFEERVSRSADMLNEMYGALARGDGETAEKIISSQLKYAISYHDQKEDFYHGFLMGLLSLNQSWTLKSNREMGLGRSDITLEDFRDAFGIVIEVKRAKNAADMEAKCEEALQQIQEKRYGEELMELTDTVWIYGIAFAEKRCRMKGKKL